MKLGYLIFAMFTLLAVALALMAALDRCPDDSAIVTLGHVLMAGCVR